MDSTDTVSAMTDIELQGIVAKNLRRIRKEHGLSQARLAGKAGISAGFVSDIETSKRWASAEKLTRIAEALGIAPFQLLLPTDDSPYFDRRRVLTSYNKRISEAFDRIRIEVFDHMNRSFGSSDISHS